jgi:hypothetical protein
VTAGIGDDDLFNFQPETLESAEDPDNVGNHLQHVSRLPSTPDPTATPCRTLIVRNVAPDSSEDEIFNIFKVTLEPYFLYSMLVHTLITLLRSLSAVIW